MARRCCGPAVQLFLQLAPGNDLRAFDGMLQQLVEKAIGLRSETVDHDGDRHGAVDIAQIEDCFGDVDERALRYQHGGIEYLMTRALQRRLTVAYTGHT